MASNPRKQDSSVNVKVTGKGKKKIKAIPVTGREGP
jgi:hypothetical protein